MGTAIGPVTKVLIHNPALFNPEIAVPANYLLGKSVSSKSVAKVAIT